MRALAAKFVPAADEVHSLQRRSDPEAKLFQKIAEEGHYAGRTQPSDTRQGTYALSPSGVFLASINHNDPARMAEMLERALAKWNKLSPEERLMTTDPTSQAAAAQRPERFYPKGGLVLRVFTRDLPREIAPADWRAHAWNQDFAWFRKEEARSFLPAELKEGSTGDVPEALVRRIARTALQDNVRGQTTAYPDRAVKDAWMISKVEAVRGAECDIVLVGKVRVDEEGTWAIAGFRDMNSPTAQRRGIEARLYGRAVFDRELGKFREFELVSLGSRWGATQYNGRSDDIGPAGIGHLLVLAGDSPEERVAPAHIGVYGWR